MDSRWPLKGRFCLAKRRTISRRRWGISFHLLDSVEISCWRWQSMVAPFWSRADISFQRAKAAKWSCPFSWLEIAGLSFHHFVNPSTLPNDVFFSGWNSRQQKQYKLFFFGEYTIHDRSTFSPFAKDLKNQLLDSVWFTSWPTRSDVSFFVIRRVAANGPSLFCKGPDPRRTISVRSASPIWEGQSPASTKKPKGMTTYKCNLSFISLHLNTFLNEWTYLITCFLIIAFVLSLCQWGCNFIFLISAIIRPWRGVVSNI